MRSRRYLERNSIEYDWIDIDQDHQGELFVMKVNHGMRSVPTILLPDGSILVEPSNEELKSRLVIG